MKNKKTNQNNVLIIAAIIFVIIAVIVFVIALSLFNSRDSSGGESSLPSVDIGSSSDSMPESSSSSPSQKSSSQSSAASSSSQGSSHSSSQSSAVSSSSQSSSQSRPQSSSSSSQSGSQSSSAGSADFTLAERIVENARQLIGTPFKDGGVDPEGFDSSGFIYYVMRESGFVSCPRDIALQATMGVMREYDELEVGDLVFFSNDIGGKPNFAGFYSGDGKMIGCLITSSFEGVVEVNITGNYYKQHFVSGVGIN